MIHNSITNRLTFLCLSLFLCSCSTSPTSPDVQYDKAINFNEFHSYHIKPVLVSNSDIQIENKFSIAINENLNKKGFTLKKIIRAS